MAVPKAPGHVTALGYARISLDSRARVKAENSRWLHRDLGAQLLGQSRQIDQKPVGMPRLLRHKNSRRREAGLDRPGVFRFRLDAMHADIVRRRSDRSLRSRA